MDGIVSGSGGGLAIPGRYKVACETTAFVMPNTGIGWHLDGGAAHYLARLPHHIGTFLALTGSTLKAQDVM
jgi:enoyl-CoA hydratase/carnithine racemase